MCKLSGLVLTSASEALPQTGKFQKILPAHILAILDTPADSPLIPEKLTHIPNMNADAKSVGNHDLLAIGAVMDLSN